MIDRRLFRVLARRCSLSPDAVWQLERWCIEDSVARRLMVHASDGLNRRHLWFTRYCLDKTAERFYEVRQRPALDAMLAELAA